MMDSPDDDDIDLGIDREEEQLETLVAFQARMTASYYHELRQAHVPWFAALILTRAWLKRFMKDILA